MHYIICFVIAFIISLILTPIVRKISLKLNILDIPHSDVKTHKLPVPYLGGVSIIIGFWLSILIIRLITHFPTGTLYSLRGILYGSLIICLLGLIDDIKYNGLHFKIKFFIEIIVSIILFFYGIRIKFITPDWFALLISLIWIVGIINALNIIDIMDGLSSGIAVISALSFFFIGLPKEEEIYVNFASIALVGSCLGFIPYNLSSKYKIFMGDTGSLFIGFILASISLGTRYSGVHNIGIFVPILLLAIPIYDTLLVIYFRWRKGISPFLGSKDHFALRLRQKGYSDKTILLTVYIIAAILGICGFLITILPFFISILIYSFVLLFGIILGYKLSLIKV